MSSLDGKNIVVVGAGQGVGCEIVAIAGESGARVLAVARREATLARLTDRVPGTMTLRVDATEKSAPDRVFQSLSPDVLVLCGGANPVMAAVQDQTWEQFSGVWDADVKASFHFCKAALRKPLAPGSAVVLLSSGAALMGSHLSGSYAGAKRMQMFLAEYCQKQSDRSALGIRFLAVAPARIMPGTELGKIAVTAYSEYLGIKESEFIAGAENTQTPAQVAEAVVRLVCETPQREGSVFSVSATGIEAVG
ncbi:MAG: SDR family oxidoreductase [Fibrella sp.]|nr:SDR family oxidoreductase [Armatimonadota bacterium]